MFEAAPEYQPRHDDLTIATTSYAFWKPEKGITPEFANEIWRGIESIEPHCARQQLPCSVLKASIVFRAFGATSSTLQPKIQTLLKRLSAYWHLRHDMQSPPDPVGSETDSLVGNHSVRKTRVSRDKHHRPLFLARRDYFGFPQRDGGTQSQHVWRIALQSASLHTLVHSYTDKTFSKS